MEIEALFAEKWKELVSATRLAFQTWDGHKIEKFLKVNAMKRNLATMTVLVSWTVFAATATVDGIKWTYTVSNGEASLGGGDIAIPTSTTGAIVIPSELDGYPVTSIEAFAFSGCSGLNSVTLRPEVNLDSRSKSEV